MKQSMADLMVQDALEYGIGYVFYPFFTDVDPGISPPRFMSGQKFCIFSGSNPEFLLFLLIEGLQLFYFFPDNYLEIWRPGYSSF